MDNRIADIATDSISTVLVSNTIESRYGAIDRIVPSGFREVTVGTANHWSAQAIGIVMQVSNRRAFGTDETGGHWVILVSTDRNDPVVFDNEL